MYHPYGGDNYVGTGVPRRLYGILNPNICRLRYMPKGREGTFCFDSMKAAACVRFVVVSVLPLHRSLASMFSILSCFPPFSLIRLFAYKNTWSNRPFNQECMRE